MLAETPDEFRYATISKETINEDKAFLLAITIICVMANSYVVADDDVKGKSLGATMLNKGEMHL